MHTTDIIKRLRETTEFKSWNSKNKDAKLVHLFLMIDPDSDFKYDIGFYDFENKVMTSFTVDEKLATVEVRQDNEIFQKDQTEIKPIDEKRLKVGFEEACSSCRKLQQEKYKSHEPIKEVVILQNLPCGQVWNITYITKSFQTLNIKVDAETGKIIEDKLHQIFSFTE